MSKPYGSCEPDPDIQAPSFVEIGAEGLWERRLGWIPGALMLVVGCIPLGLWVTHALGWWR